MASSTQGYVSGLMDTLWPIMFVLVVSVLFYVFREQIRNSILRKAIPWLLLGLILVFESGMLFNLIMAPFQPWSITVRGLPLHLCSTSAVLVMLFLSTKKEFFLDILLIQGIVGALVTFAFPTVSDYPMSYSYIKFFLSHTILFITPMFYIIIEQKKINRKILIKSLIVLHAIAAVAITTNVLFGTHYMYVLPDNTENLYAFLPLHQAFPFMANWPWVILFGELMAFPAYFLFYFGIKKLQNVV
jgi:hypothetical integral membrane protein (TIGR02206 family)